MGPGESRPFAFEAAVQYPLVALFASGECVLEGCIFALCIVMFSCVKLESSMLYQERVVECCFCDLVYDPLFMFWGGW